MFNKELGLMLYVDDVAAEKSFWSAAGFVIENEAEMMGFETFDMKSHADATTTITVYAKEFIAQVSPEVLDNVPSVLFETSDIAGLQECIAGLTDTCSPVNEQPFPNFNFACPSGIYFAVKGV
ncbi:glyoxalase [Streptococcus sp. A34]|uniref:glyoxalase n=1 Tax=Streptococcus sp. A34 TaxID=3373130 RepID=UPI00374CFD67